MTTSPRDLREQADNLYTEAAEWRRRGNKYVAKNMATAAWELKKAANKIEIIEHMAEFGKRPKQRLMGR